MKDTGKWGPLALAVAAANGLVATQAVAQGEGFVEGATATLESRTLYFNRDYRDPGQANQNTANMSRAEEAATGFILNFQSGYTQGPVGLGADVLALAGIKLDSSGGHNGRLNMLPTRSDGDRSEEHTSELQLR